jgi:hypothetical protein
MNFLSFDALLIDAQHTVDHLLDVYVGGEVVSR